MRTGRIVTARFTSLALLTLGIVFSSALAYPKAAYAACTLTGIVLATGASDPSSATIAPGTATTTADSFTFAETHTGSCSGTADTVTQLVITLAPSFTAAAPYGIDFVTMTASNGTSVYFTKVASTSISSKTITFSGGTGMPVTYGSATTYLIRFAPLSHAAMPAPPGASYAIQATTTSWTSTNTSHSGSDTMANTITIDNLSPNGATSVSGSASNQANTLNWTTSNSADFQTSSGSVVLRWTSGSVGSEVPAEGTTYSAGNTIGSATVACVISSSGSTALSKTDGLSGSAGCTTSALSVGTAYSYKVFQQDTSGNYDTGTTIGTFTPTNATAPTVTTNSAESFTPTSATLFGAITATGGASITDSGFAVGTGSTLSTNVSTTSLGSQSGAVSFNTATTTLSANTTYFYRAYATNSAGTSYGSILSFPTGNATPARKMRLFEGFTVKLLGGGTLKLLQQ